MKNLKHIEILENFCKNNNVGFTYTSKWTAIIDLPTQEHPSQQLMVDIENKQKINRAIYLVEEYLNNSSKINI